MTELTGYLVHGYNLDIRPAPTEREWMDESSHRFAYRCLPLNIANSHGWEILCPAGFSAVWDGGRSIDAVRVEASPGRQPPAISHFGGGVLTFHVPCVFRTEAGFDLYITGPVNRPKDGISALSAIVEADWSPYSFTMNWLFTRPDHPVFFEEGEPYCHVFPVQRGLLEAISPVLRRMSDDEELHAEHELWSASRNDFNAGLQQAGSKATRDGWQKTYFRGRWPSGRPAPEGHRSRVRLKPFEPPE